MLLTAANTATTTAARCTMRTAAINSVAPSAPPRNSATELSANRSTGRYAWREPTEVFNARRSPRARPAGCR